MEASERIVGNFLNVFLESEWRENGSFCLEQKIVQLSLPKYPLVGQKKMPLEQQNITLLLYI